MGGWKRHETPPDIRERAKREFDEEEYLAEVREIERTGGVRFEDFIGEVEGWFAAALRESHHRLCVYPQFGDPLIDLKAEPGQMWIGTVPPLVMRYGLYEDRRLVLVVVLPELLPGPAG